MVGLVAADCQYFLGILLWYPDFIVLYRTSSLLNLLKLQHHPHWQVKTMPRKISAGRPQSHHSSGPGLDILTNTECPPKEIIFRPWSQLKWNIRYGCTSKVLILCVDRLLLMMRIIQFLSTDMHYHGISFVDLQFLFWGSLIFG
jgi:hypothetical protein